MQIMLYVCRFESIHDLYCSSVKFLMYTLSFHTALNPSFRAVKEDVSTDLVRKRYWIRKNTIALECFEGFTRRLVDFKMIFLNKY